MKVILKVFFLLIFLAIAGCGLFLWLFDINSYRDTITQKLSAALNRPVQIEKIEMNNSLLPKIVLTNVRIGNSDGAPSNEPLATIQTVELMIELPALMNNRIQIRDIKLKQSKVNIIESDVQDNSAGKGTGSTRTSDISNLAKNPLLTDLRLDMFQADVIEINYVKGDIKERVFIKNLMVQQLKATSMTIEYKEVPMQLTANMSLLDLLKMKNNFVFNTTFKAMDVMTKVSGSIGDMKALQNMLLNVEVYSDDTSKISSTMGLPPIPLPEVSFSSILKGDLNKMNIQSFKFSLGDGLDVDIKGTVEKIKTDPSGQLSGTIAVKNSPFLSMLGFKPVNITVDTLFKKDSLDISKLLISATRTELSSAFRANWKNNKVNVIGNVTSNFFDIRDFYENPFSDDKKKGKEQKKTTASVTTEPSANKTADDTILKNLNVQIDWNIKNIKLVENSDEYYGIYGRTTLKDGIFTVNPMQIRTIAGLVNIATRIQNILGNPQIQLTFTGDNIDLDKIKSLHKYVAGSTANVSGKLVSSGKTKESLLSHLTGQVEVEVTQGKIVDKWFNELPTVAGFVTKTKSFSFSKSDTESALNCAVMNVKLDNGIAHMDKSVAIETSILDIMLSGQVDLPKETLSVALTPSLPTATQSALMDAVRLIRIEGPIDKPAMNLDNKAAVTAVVQKGLEKGIDKGLEKLMDKAGLTSEQPQTTQTPAAVKTTAKVREPLSLCEAALGHKLKGKKSFDIVVPVEEVVAPETTAPVQKEEEKLSPQEILKRQLLQSITSPAQ